jgi:RNA polymerase sigma factor (sigma-70 family)
MLSQSIVVARKEIVDGLRDGRSPALRGGEAVRRPLGTRSGYAIRRPIRNRAWHLGERAVRLRRVVHRLPLVYRQVVMLTLEGLGYGEISEVLGISESNVGARLKRARQMLRESLENRK